MNEAASTIAPKRTARLRGWFDKQSAQVGLGTGVLGGVCCIGSAVAVGAGVGGLSFFSTWVDRYQGYFIAGSVALMLVWLIRLGRRHGLSRRGLGRTARLLARHAVVMGAVYLIVLGLAAGAMQATEAL
jgi:hypothetical protein